MSQEEKSSREMISIATEIQEDWGDKVNFAAAPYLNAMFCLKTPYDEPEMFVHDGGTDTIARFLCNAGTWRGEVARRVKAELNGLLKAGRL